MDFKSLLSQLDQLNEAKKPQVEEGRSDEADDDYDAEAEAEKAEEKAEAKRKAKREEIDEGYSFNEKTGRWRQDDGTSFDEEDLDDEQKARVEKWKKDNPGKRRGRPAQSSERGGNGSVSAGLTREGIMDEPATKDTPTGRIHKAKPGGYGRKDDEDDEGKKVKADAPKRGRGRPKKGGDETGEVKKYDWSAFGAPKKDIKLPKWDKSKTTKHSLKDWVEHIEGKYIAEGEQIQIKPASQMSKLPGQTSIGQKQSVAGQPQKNTQVIAQGNKTLGTVDNPQLAQQIKQSIGKGEMTLMPDQEMTEAGEFRQNYTPAPEKKGLVGKLANVAKKVGKAITGPDDDELLARLQQSAGVKKAVKEADIPTDQNDMGAGLGAGRSQSTFEGKDEGKPGKNFAKIAKSAGEKYGSKAAGERVAGAVRAKLAKQGKLEEAKPDFLDLDKDGDKKESMKKAAKDKKTVKEAAEHRLKAAHHRGKAHALAKESYNCKYDDMEESRMYHEGYKEGLDECYGQAPIAGMVGENNPAIVDDMASFGAHHDDAAMDEGNAFSAALARTPAGGQFKVGGKSFTDRSGYDSDLDEMTQSIAFESWDNQLNSLLTEGEQVDEGMTVSISKGQQGSPDSVSVTAQDGEADQLLAAIKQAGLGLFGGDDGSAQQGSTPMSVAVDGQPDEAGAAGAEIDVVDDHDGMMSLIKKMTGGAVGGSDEGSSEDYADEEGHEEHGHEEACDACGSSDCQCDSEEVVDEVENYDQEEEEVAEDNPPDSDAAETTADENAEAQEDEALAQADSEEVSEGGDGGEASEEDDEEQVEESYANSEDDGYEADMNFMLKAIAGGLNKEKSTGQTTIPVIAGQGQRVGVSENSISDWKKLAGI